MCAQGYGSRHLPRAKYLTLNQLCGLLIAIKIEKVTTRMLGLTNMQTQNVKYEVQKLKICKIFFSLGITWRPKYECDFTEYFLDFLSWIDFEYC